MYDYLDEYTKPDQCPSYKLMSSHYLVVWHLNELRMLDENIILESFTTFDFGYDEHTDYYIFRDRGKLSDGSVQQELVRNQLTKMLDSYSKKIVN